MPKFKINDKLQTNLEYTKGFVNSRIIGQDPDVSAPSGLNWLKDLIVIEIIKTHETKEQVEHISNNRQTSNFIYICQSKTREYILNECFLEYA